MKSILNKLQRMSRQPFWLMPLLAVVLNGCDSNPPESACLNSGNPWCSNYVPPGTGGNNSDGGGGNGNAGTGGGTTPNVNCGALPQFNCFGSCVNLTGDAENCGSCGRVCTDGQTCSDGHCAWNSPPDQCVPSSEVCNNIDDDCDTQIDEDANLLSDSANCGLCGRACSSGQSCVSGHCSWNTPQNGCTPSLETCDGIDNDCDLGIDEGFNLLADPDNCGACGNTCDDGQHCTNGHCVLDTPANNCVSVAETCNNADDDCDGVIDNGINLLTDQQHCGTCDRICSAGQSCTNGHCSWNNPVEQCIPKAEVCDNADNNCDSKIDEGFNLLADPLNCGTCGRACDPGAVCFNGVCRFPAPVDQCTPLPAELCNNRDDTCNGFVDEGFSLLTDGANCGMCGRACGAGAVCDNGHCQNTVPVLNCTGTPEVCDYTDNDCDGQIDELIVLLSDEANCGVCGLACAVGQVCDTGHCQWITPPPNCTPVQETCNGNDDDCDGVIDDGFSLLIDPANCGMCGHTCGAGQHCQNGACALDVPANNCVPVGEVCNNLDDNCNGFIDEGINLLIDKANCGTCGHVCPAGQACDNGHCLMIVPNNSCVSAAETCNNVDDDCDSAVDEDFNLNTDPVNCGFCGHICAANQHCANGHCSWNQVQNNCAGVAETCNQTDDDCDGQIDEDFNLSNDSANCGVCGHACGATQYCLNGHCANQTPANICTPVGETCNNVDDNCNGNIDEGFDLSKDKANCGVCGRACPAGQTCSNGTCALIVPANNCVPVAETCNNSDDDCDTFIDEGFNLLIDTNNCGMCGHACAANQHCAAGTCVWDVPQNVCAGVAEICNNADDDCDGAIDEGFTLASDPTNCGVCGHSCAANQVCQNGHCAWLVPQNGCTINPEVCDNVDNDCDGSIDENTSLSSDNANCGVCGRACAAGQHCVTGACVWNTPQSSCVPAAEICDQADNDCDGAIDENTSLQTDPLNCGTCGRVCAAGQHCESGFCTWNTPINLCGAPQSESCDQEDNDCDGFIDEDFNLLVDELNCGVCGHACLAGQHCESGHCAWDSPLQSCVPAGETCNSIDDDCDDLIDEDFNLLLDELNCGACGNACQAGQSCSGGHCRWDVPQQDCVSVGETCNSVDDDCDGFIDENYNLQLDLNNCGTCGRTCGAGQICQAGHCQYIIPQLSCAPVAETCNNNDDDCDGVIDDGYNLLNDPLNCGICGRNCGAGRTCNAGKCVNILPVSNCTPSNETCNNADDDCDGVIDNTFNLQTDEANCGICGQSCAAGQSCQSGHCTWNIPQTYCVISAEVCDQIDNDCDGSIDENWNFLNDPQHCGNCFTSCGAGQFCLNGHCALP